MMQNSYQLKDYNFNHQDGKCIIYMIEPVQFCLKSLCSKETKMKKQIKLLLFWKNMTLIISVLTTTIAPLTGMCSFITISL